MRAFCSRASKTTYAAALEWWRRALSITTKFTENLQKNNICPAEAGCEKVVVESVTPKEKRIVELRFASVFGYTLSDLMRLTGRPAPTRMSGPPGRKKYYGDDTDGYAVEQKQAIDIHPGFHGRV